MNQIISNSTEDVVNKCKTVQQLEWYLDGVQSDRLLDGSRLNEVADAEAAAYPLLEFATQISARPDESLKLLADKMIGHLARFE